ncbi:MAG: hypothetical protein JWN75_966 [Candidatus Saccharibacteria bacterium]|nr:hypothetical protein [Candidatus Saccharibacteria bacterium]
MVMTDEQLIHFLRKEVRAAYRRASRAKHMKDWQYFYKETRYGRKKFYRRKVICLCIERDKFYADTYLIDRRGNIYSGCPAMGSITTTEVFAGYSRRSVDKQMEMYFAEKCHFKKLNPWELDRNILSYLFEEALSLAI